MSDRVCVLDKLVGKVLSNQNTMNFAQAHDFYEFVDLDPEELKCLVLWTRNTFPCGIGLIESMLSVMVLNVLRFRVEKQDWSENFKEAFDLVRSKLQFSDMQEKTYKSFYSFASNHVNLPSTERDAIKDLTANGFEDFHCAIENGASIVLDIAKRGDLSFFMEDRQRVMYLYVYLYNQFFRSRKYLKLIQDSDSVILRKAGATFNLARNFRYFLPVLYYFLSDRLRNQRKMAVVRNESAMEFITSDAPVVLRDGLHDGLPTLIYFPLSPKATLLYGIKKKVNKIVSNVGRKIQDKNVVAAMNQWVVEECDRFIFGSSRQVLESLL